MLSNSAACAHQVSSSAGGARSQPCEAAIRADLLPTQKCGNLRGLLRAPLLVLYI